MSCTHEDHPHNALLETIELDEMYYKDMMRKIVPGWLPHRDYAHLIKSVNYKGRSGNTLRFFVPNKYNGWYCYVRFDEWETEVRDLDITAVEAARLLFWGANIRLHCSCPSFLFHGYEYILTQTDSAIVPEMRFPHVNNPRLMNTACKHLRRVLPVLGYHLGDIARGIKEDRQKL
jgi:hypothetical protein